jgi:AraC-like DNA-binding protein
VPRARVTGFEHELGSGTRAVRTAAPALAGVLSRPLVGYRHAAAGFDAWLEPPRPEVTLMIAFDGAITADGAPLPGAWIGGLTGGPTIVGVGATFEAIDLKLDPLAAYRVLGTGLSALSGACVALEDVFGRDVRDCLGRLAEAPGWDARFDVLERWLGARLADAPAPDPVIARAFAMMSARRGQVRIGELAAELGMSRRHLGGRFAAQLGLPPKAVARQLRFAAVRRAIERRPGAWARIAAEAGYADQSHLVRDFRELAGVTPTQFVARLMPEGGVVGDGL